jgi:hypothetical protein
LVSSRSDAVSCSREGDNNLFGCVATGNDESLFTSKDRSPISGMLSPILNFITSSDVLQFLKQAAVHDGLRNTQIFDLLWVLNNLFNIHGGVWLSHWFKGVVTLTIE